MNATTTPVFPAHVRTAAQVRVQAPGVNASAEETEAFFARSVACLDAHGYVSIEGAIPRDVVQSVLRFFQQAYDQYMRPGQKRLFRNFQDDPLRAQVPVAPEGPIADPRVYCNPLMMGIANRMLGSKVVIGEMGGVISHPGAEAQYSHRDSEFLFGGVPAEIALPPHSLTALIPLLDVPLEMGPTEYWPGSHLAMHVSEDALPECVPLRAGSIVIWNARLLHRGGANRSDTVRPAIYITYQRPWFVERSGYDSKPQLRITPRMLRAIPAEDHRLFNWALHLNRADSLDEFVMRWLGRIRSRLRR